MENRREHQMKFPQGFALDQLSHHLNPLLLGTDSSGPEYRDFSRCARTRSVEQRARARARARGLRNAPRSWLTTLTCICTHTQDTVDCCCAAAAAMDARPHSSAPNRELACVPWEERPGHEVLQRCEYASSHALLLAPTAANTTRGCTHLHLQEQRARI